MRSATTCSRPVVLTWGRWARAGHGCREARSRGARAPAIDLLPAPAGRPDDWTERAVAWLERTCAEQGVPVKITDPVVLDKIAKILRPDTDQSPGGR
jgi:hypothetical protein